MTGMRDAATAKLFGFTTLKYLGFEFDSARLVCDLTLELQNPASERVLNVILTDVSSLKLKEFGGGLTQLLYLMIEDIRDRQIDRVNFHVKDVERGMLE